MSRTPGIRGLNHLTLAVGELERSLRFYVDLLGCRLRARWATGAYLDAGSLWLCLAEGHVEPTATDYTHVAFDVADADFDRLAEAVRKAGVREWQANRSEGASLYILDPDDRRLELHSGDLASRLTSYGANSVTPVTIVDVKAG